MKGKRLKYKGFRMKKIALLVISALFFISTQMVRAEIPSDIQKLYDDKKYDEAITKIQDALKKDKRNASLYYILGQTYVKTHDTIQAISALSDAVKYDSKLHQARYLLGKLYLGTNQLEDAKKTFEEGLKKAKDKQDIALFDDGLGLYYYQQKDFTNADIEFRKAEIEDPNNINYIMHQGDVAYEQGIYAIALNAYKKAYATDSTNPELNYRIAKSLLNQKQFKEALDYIDKTLQLDSSYYDAYIMGGDIYTLYGVQQADNPEAQQQLLSNAIFYYNLYLEKTGDSGRANYYRGKAYFSLNDYENAVKDFQSAQRQGVDKPDLMALIGRSYSRLKDYSRAVEALNDYEKSVLQADPNYQWTKEDASIFLERAKAEAGIGDSTSRLTARQDFQKALELDSTDAGAFYAAGINEYYLKDYNKAVEYLNKSLELYPDNPGAYLNIAYSYLALKDWDNTIAYLDTAQSRNPEYTGAYKLKANVYLQMKNYDSSLVYYLKWKEIEPENCEPDRWIGLIYLIKEKPNATKSIQHLKQYQNCRRAKGENLCDDVEVYLWISNAYQLNNDANSAYDTAKQGLKCDPNNADLQKIVDDLEFEID
jgi:tetratricopeptide (TPR) repeat protein